MKFLILDESDKQQNGKRKYFLISGLLMDEANLLNLNNELETYKLSEGFVNLKDLRKSRMFQEEKLKKTRNIFTILNKYNVKILTAILGETTMGSIQQFEKAYIEALYFLIERFALQIRPDTGMIFFDKMEGSVQNYIEEEFFKIIQEEELVMYGKKLGHFKDIVYPSISFINDKFNSILQVSDLISMSFNFAVSNSLKKYEYINILEFETLSPYLRIYWPLVVKSTIGKHEGWGIKLWN